MKFHELFLEIKSLEIKDLEYCNLLSNVRECYEKVIEEGCKDLARGQVVNRLINMRFTVNPNDFIELVNIEKDAVSFDYMAEFNPTQKNAINLLLSVVDGSQEGSYFKSFFALYIWKNLLPDVRFYSVGLTEHFYQIAEERNNTGKCIFKPAEQISNLIAEEKQTGFFHLSEDDYCDESQALIQQLDDAIAFIIKDYA